MTNEVLETILKRSSIRAYSPEKLTDEELAALKTAALAAPTAMNRQEQRFVFVTDPDKLELLEKSIMDNIIRSGSVEFAERIKARGGRTTYWAPLVVIICSKPSHFSRVDAGIAVENIALAAKSIGLDSVILGMPEGAFTCEGGEALKEAMRFPEGYEFSIAIAVGHRAMDKAPHERNEEHVINV